MADFPSVTNSFTTPRYLSNYSRYSALWPISITQGNIGGGTSVTWTTANMAIFIPMTVPWPYNVQRVFWLTAGAGATNIDFGIYTPDGARVYSTGSTSRTANPAAIQFATVGTPFVLEPGNYYFAMTASNASSGQSFSNGGTLTQPRWRQIGAVEQQSALPLPATATFATVSGSNSYGICGVTRLASGF